MFHCSFFPFQHHLRPEVASLPIYGGQGISWRKAHFYMPEFINDHRCFHRKNVHSYRDSFSCQLWLPVEERILLGNSLASFQWIKTSTTISVQHPLGRCDSCHRTTAPVRSPHTSYRWRGERVIEPIKWMGITRRPWLTRASGGNLASTSGLHPYSLREVPWDF